MFSQQEISSIIHDLRRVERQLLGTDVMLFFSFLHQSTSVCILYSVADFFKVGLSVIVSVLRTVDCGRLAPTFRRQCNAVRRVQLKHVFKHLKLQPN